MATHRKAGTRGVPRAVREPQILRVAGRVFAARGYHAASMDEIAAEADVTKPMIYAYFGSKESLYVAYIERAGRDLLERIRAGDDASAPAEQRLRTGVREFFGFVEERSDGWKVLYTEFGGRGGPLGDEVTRVRERIVRMIGELLAEGAGGKTKPALRDGLAHAFVGAGESLANWWLATPALSRDEVADLLVAFGQAGAPRPPQR